MRYVAWLIAGTVLVAGCGSKDTMKVVPTLPKKATPAEILSLTGPGGKVSIGDGLDAAKKAFPAPEGAQKFDTTMSFTIVSQQGWTWGIEKPTTESFEAAVKGGKIVAMARTLGTSTTEPQATISELGEPSRKAEGKTASIYVWDAGDNARIVVHMKSNVLMPLDLMMLIGKKEDLKLLNYRADDPDTFVKQMDAAAEMQNSPEMRKVFEEAKQRAKDKAKNR
jgi:hypothetical protein